MLVGWRSTSSARQRHDVVLADDGSWAAAPSTSPADRARAGPGTSSRRAPEPDARRGPVFLHAPPTSEHLRRACRSAHL